MRGDLQRNFGHNLRAYRLSQGHSQESFAYVLVRHRTLVGAMERGERNLALQTVEKIAEQLGLDPLEMLQPPSG